jgi:hypothetical protein
VTDLPEPSDGVAYVVSRIVAEACPSACDHDPPDRLGEVPARKRSGPSGPSGDNTVPKRSIRIPDDLWAAAGEKAAQNGTDRNKVVNELLAAWVAEGRVGA